MSNAKYKVAAVQAAPAFLDLEGSVEKAISFHRPGRGRGRPADRLSGNLDTRLPLVDLARRAGLGDHARLRLALFRQFAFSYDSPEAERLRGAAAKTEKNIRCALGLSERDGGSLYIAQWIIGPDGETVAKRRKLKPTHAERTVFGEGDGSHLAVHDLEVGRLGALCCWEHLQPLSKYAMYAQNEQVHVAAWPSFSLYDPFAHALGAEVNNAASKIYAVEGSCFVIAPCATVSQAMIDELCDTPEKHQFLHAGGGFAVDLRPRRSPLAPPLPPDQEGLLYADIDLGMISVAKAAADPAGHYARPDVTRLLFNNRPAGLMAGIVGGRDHEKKALPIIDAVSLSKPRPTAPAQSRKPRRRTSRRSRRCKRPRESRGRWMEFAIPPHLQVGRAPATGGCPTTISCHTRPSLRAIGPPSSAW